MGLLFIKICHSPFLKARLKLIKITQKIFSLNELVTKNLEVKDKFNYQSHKIVDSYENSFLSNPISLRLWSSFFKFVRVR